MEEGWGSEMSARNCMNTWPYKEAAAQPLGRE